ncbi:MAG: tRNA1(Val) (adenine(37)-N6)-methyltransferase [Catonella sp.]|uniref:tRNA1(Val) (adenine(37)-N6)-methyltransferase n=1 Tax=Catonella sp. TaxID=2382125 RepID=UPI003FA0D344
MEFELKEKERLDDLEISGLHIIQSPDKFCFGMDAVLLSGFAYAKKGNKVIDLGTGTGILPLLLWAKTDGEHFTGLEIQEESADMARRSIEGNKITNIDIINGDIKDVSRLFDKQSFDIVTSNPPYMINEHGIVNPDAPKQIARHEILCNLEDVVKAAGYLLKANGKFFMVHRPFRLPEIFESLKKYSLEPKRMRLVYPSKDKEPNMVLIEAVKYGKPRLKVEKPLIVYDDSGKYTEEMMRDYRY